MLVTLTLALPARHQRGLALFVVVAGVGALVLGSALKELVGRLCPVVEVPVATAPGPSFPSGHTLAATVWVGTVLLVLLLAVPQRARRQVLAVGVAVVVALARLYRGAHFPTDVLGSVLFAVPWLVLTLRLVGVRPPPRPSHAPGRRAAIPATGSCLAALPPDDPVQVVSRVVVDGVEQVGQAFDLRNGERDQAGVVGKPRPRFARDHVVPPVGFEPTLDAV